MIDATWVGGLRDLARFLNDRVDSECEKDWTQEFSMLNPSGAGDNLRSDAIGAGEKGAFETVTAQDRGAMHRVERIGDVH